MRKVKFKKHRACLNMKCGNKTIFEIQYRSYLLDTKAEKQVFHNFTWEYEKKKHSRGLNIALFS